MKLIQNQLELLIYNNRTHKFQMFGFTCEFYENLLKKLFEILLAYIQVINIINDLLV